LRILLAEDNGGQSAAGDHLLEETGPSVVIASNGLQALAALEAQRFDACSMDVQMPEWMGSRQLPRSAPAKPEKPASISRSLQ